jgi:hypothetical protein
MFKKITLWGLMVLCTLNFSGCVFLLIPLGVAVVGGVGIGIGTAKWLSDKLVERVPYSFAKTKQAARDGVKDLNLEIIKEADTDTLTQINCKYSDGRTVWVNVMPASKTVSRIEVRVGVWGGQVEARKVLDGILSRLK